MIRRLFSATVSAAFVTALAVNASAEPSATERAVAQTLFDEGRQLMAEKKYAEACAKFAKSQEIDPSAGTFINLALCHESEGKLATAWAEFNEALSQALRDGRADREKSAREHIESIKPRLCQLTVRVADPAKINGFQVTLDGTPMKEAMWGVPTPIDPGKHLLVASAPKKQSYTTSVSFEDPGVARTVDLPPLQNEAPPPVEKGKRGCSCDATSTAVTFDPSWFVLGLWAVARVTSRRSTSAAR